MIKKDGMFFDIVNGGYAEILNSLNNYEFETLVQTICVNSRIKNIDGDGGLAIKKEAGDGELLVSIKLELPMEVSALLNEDSIKVKPSLFNNEATLRIWASQVDLKASLEPNILNINQKYGYTNNILKGFLRNHRAFLLSAVSKNPKGEDIYYYVSDEVIKGIEKETGNENFILIGVKDNCSYHTPEYIQSDKLYKREELLEILKNEKATGLLIKDPKSFEIFDVSMICD